MQRMRLNEIAQFSMFFSIGSWFPDAIVYFLFMLEALFVFLCENLEYVDTQARKWIIFVR